ncbi:MAG: ABC transporter substrate-binding protein [Pseudomonadota bacterium]
MKLEAWIREQREPVRDLVKQVREGDISKREFIALASTFGASAAFSYGVLGMPRPAMAQSDGKMGGTLKVGMRILDLKDPRTWDWTEPANVGRQFMEPLVRWDMDFSFTGMLAESWEVSDDVKTYTLRLRQGVTWNNGDDFTSEDVLFNIARWCDKSAEGNSMAARMAALIDEDTGQMRDGAVVALDDHTVQLNLLDPDISLIAGMIDYPGLIAHRSYDPATGLVASPIGTGPFELDEYEIGVKASVNRRTNGSWWGGEVFLDRVEFIDYGTDQAALMAAFESEEIHMNDQSIGEFIEVFDGLGLIKKSKATASTICARMRPDSSPLDVKEVRNAVQMAVDNAVVLELGFNNNGSVAENHHMGPMHPEYAELPAVPHDPAKALEMLKAAGHEETEIELISIDGDWRTATTDAIGAQLRSAGFNIKRTVIPGATFWNDWTKYPFSTTNWGARPLGVQVYALAYRSGEAWNESGHENPEFDAKLAEAMGVFDAGARSEIMAELQAMLQDSGAMIQPFWANETMHHVEAVKNIERHQFREMHFEKVWLDA